MAQMARESSGLDEDIIHLTRFFIEDRRDDIVALLRRSLRGVAHRRPELADSVGPLLAQVGFAGPTRRAESTMNTTVVPVDLDSRLDLLRRDFIPGPEIEPAWPPAISQMLEDVVEERHRSAELLSAGLFPSRSLLFVGPPGVGKTLASRWLAHRLGWPLLTLDLAAVMSSLLGRTGSNLRVVLDYARQSPAVLLLDEFDSIAKRRDDSAEVGELKRLVTVLLQAVDDWPPSGLLIAATNHPGLLDPAVWRRFERVVEFPKPNIDDMRKVLARTFAGDPSISGELLDLIATLSDGGSFADLERTVNTVRRSAVLRNEGVQEAFIRVAGAELRASPLAKRIAAARALATRGSSQRRIHEVTGLSRDTIRKHLGSGKGG